jgi:cell division septation protein DedD
MKDIDTEDTRVGTACTFTGRGAWQGRARHRLAVIAGALAVMCLLAIGDGYFMSRSPGPPALPPAPRDAVNVPAPDVSGAPQIGPRWSLPTPPPILPLPRSGQAGNENTSPDRSPGAQHAPGSRARASAGAAEPGRAAPAFRFASAQKAAVSPGAAAPSRFHVQAGSYPERDLAVSLLMRLRGRGYAATLVAGKVYRVWVGGYLDRVTAERLVSSLRVDGFEATLTPR